MRFSVRVLDLAPGERLVRASRLSVTRVLRGLLPLAAWFALATFVGPTLDRLTVGAVASLPPSISTSPLLQPEMLERLLAVGRLVNYLVVAGLFVRFLLTVLDWFRSRIVLTDRRLIVERGGLLRRRLDVPLGAIAAATTTTAPFGGSGRLELSLTGTQADASLLRVDGVPAARDLVERILSVRVNALRIENVA